MASTTEYPLPTRRIPQTNWHVDSEALSTTIDPIEQEFAAAGFADTVPYVPKHSDNKEEMRATNRDPDDARRMVREFVAESAVEATVGGQIRTLTELHRVIKKARGIARQQSDLDPVPNPVIDTYNAAERWANLDCQQPSHNRSTPLSYMAVSTSPHRTSWASREVVAEAPSKKGFKGWLRTLLGSQS